MTYTGRLTTPEGVAIGAGYYNMTFEIYPDSVSETPLWTEHHNNTTQQVYVDELGLFEVILGTFVPLDESVFPVSTAPPYLQVTINGEVLSPRKPLTTVPYSYIVPSSTPGLADDSVESRHVAEADGSSGQDPNTGTGIKTPHIQDAAVTFEKVNPSWSVDRTWNWTLDGSQANYDGNHGWVVMKPSDGTGPSGTLIWVQNSEDQGGYGNCMKLWASRNGVSENTIVLDVQTSYWGRAAKFKKDHDDDNEYCVEIWSAWDSSPGLYVRGTLSVTGTIATYSGGSEGGSLLYADFSPRPGVLESGRGRLVDGYATVHLSDALLASVRNVENLQITLTPIGGWSGLYVEEILVDGFRVATGGGREDVEFTWMVKGELGGRDAFGKHPLAEGSD
jgi:hypothetical protein